MDGFQTSYAIFASKQTPLEYVLSGQMELGCSWMMLYRKRSRDLLLCLSTSLSFFFTCKAIFRTGKDKVTPAQVAPFTFCLCLTDLCSLGSSTQGYGLTNENG